MGLNRLGRLIAAALVVLAAATAFADPPRYRGRGGHRRGAAVLERLFRPGLVMRHQEAIGLTAAQRDAIKQAMTETERTLVDLRWTLEAEMEKLATLLDAPTIDEAGALAQAERVMQAEQRVKRAHLALLIRIRNTLTPPQREKLRALRRGDPEPPDRPAD